MTVIPFDPYVSDDLARELKVTLVDLDELLVQADFVTLHATLRPRHAAWSMPSASRA